MPGDLGEECGPLGFELCCTRSAWSLSPPGLDQALGLTLWTSEASPRVGLPRGLLLLAGRLLGEVGQARAGVMARGQPTEQHSGLGQSARWAWAGILQPGSGDL